MARHDTLAAVDLGSNSFHLQIGRVVDGQVYPLDAVREVLRLGAGLTAEKRIDRGTQAQALETLAKFAERLRGFSRQAVRAVGTNALRVAKNSPQFLREARQVLGFPIEVISGREEARLIYLGVAHSLPAAAGPQHTRRLVIDIGGGSTEIIIGTGFEPQLTESLYMGCLSYSLKFFADGKIDKPRMKAAELAARQELAGIVHGYRAAGWDEAVGSSGTARSMENILRENGFADEGLTREGLERLRALLIKHEKADPERIAGLRPNRAPVLPGGLAIMGAALDELGIEAMKVSEGALRHGVLYDLLGRVQHRDMREATVTQFGRRYHIDAAQAERVRSLSLKIYDGLAPGAERDDDVDRLVLEWAARLAEIGLSIEHAQYHKHSAYVLSNADMPGFSRMEQARLARVVLAHRGKLSKVQDAGLEGADWKLVFALRTASLILRSRTDLKLPFLRVAADAGGFAIDLPQSWLDENPLSAAATYSRSGDNTALTTTGASPESHQKPPFSMCHSLRTPATRCASARPRSGWWPTITTVPLCRGHPAALRMASTDAPGERIFEVSIFTFKALAVCWARTAGLATTENFDGSRASSHSATRAASSRPFAVNWRARSSPPASASAWRHRISSMRLV
ncbi:MAG: exopolyphosphatase [Betaproteobacteria bacterium]|nr:MAG: exopolyphosphatase [Betaproteobacteria bacterium]